MMKLNLLILQPQGYIHSLAFLDTARYLCFHLRAHSVEATISKNRPMPGMPNIIFGAHLGMPEGWIDEFNCIIFNQEQLGAGAAALPPAYLRLLRNANTIDYDPANLVAYSGTDSSEQSKGTIRSVLPLRHAPYLESLGAGTPIENRPIDLLFFGSLNPERIAIIERIEQSGIEVSRFDHPMYGPERDEYIAQAKAVLNIPFYGSNRFEQVRVFNALSVGTPVVSLRRPGLSVDSAYQDTVHWFEESNLESYFGQYFGTNDWLRKSELQLAEWREQDSFQTIGNLVANLKELEARRRAGTPHVSGARQVRLNLTGETSHRPGWVNTQSEVAPYETPNLAPDIARASVDELHTAHELDSISGVRHLLGHSLSLLKDGASVTLDCPLGVYGPESQELKALQQRALAMIRMALDDLACEAILGVTLQLEDVRSIAEATAGGQGERFSIRFMMRQRALTPREAVMARCRGLDFGSFPEDSSEIMVSAANSCQSTVSEFSLAPA
jgi:hypothetical protein